MLFHEWNWDEALEVRYEEGMERGVAIGEARLNRVKELIRRGLSGEDLLRSIEGD